MLGIATIIMTSSVAFNILKTLGAVYLLYLSIQMIKHKEDNIETEKIKKLRVFKLYRRGIVMNITNPKVSIFFLAFLPQFTNPDNGNISIQIIILGLIFIIFTLIVFSCISIIAGLIGDYLKKSFRVQKIMNKITAAIFAGLALKLIISGKN